MKRLSKNLETTRALAEAWLESELFSRVNKQKKATIVFLSGDLGSGKTTFVQMVAKILRVEKIVTSPTFILRRDYPLADNRGRFKKLIHVDCYRLKGPKELKTIGWAEILADLANLIMMEWPERVGKLKSDFIINFKTIGENEREIKF